MLKTTLGLTAAAVVLATSVAAQALTLTNRDATEYTVRISEPENEDMLVIQPEESITDLCYSSCILKLEDGKGMSFNGDETVVIENGVFLLIE